MLRSLAVVTLAMIPLASSCTRVSPIDPSEVRRGISAAVVVPLADDAGSVTIGSGGAFRTELGNAPVLHVRLVVTNRGPRPIRVPIDALRVEGGAPLETFADGIEFSAPAIVVDIDGTRQIDAVFPVGDADLGRFAVRWAVEVLPGDVARYTTSFTRIAGAFHPAG